MKDKPALSYGDEHCTTKQEKTACLDCSNKKEKNNNNNICSGDAHAQIEVELKKKG